MGLLDFLGFNRLPDGVQGSSLVVLATHQLAHARPFLSQLRQSIPNTALLLIGDQPTNAIDIPHLVVADQADAIQGRFDKIAPQRIIMLGLPARYSDLLSKTKAPVAWINAQDAAIAKAGYALVTTAQDLPGLTPAQITGDPLATIQQLPALAVNTDMCIRFKEQRESDRWLGYFAGTGESEENMAYLLFNRAIRYKMGIMLLAPRDLARCEPVYRESLKFRLQTIRHRRLSTSFVPIKTRVYYIEDAQPLADLYACVDFVIAGGTLHPDATAQPDLLLPILHGKPVIVGAAHRDNPLVASAIQAGVVLAADDEEQLFKHIHALIDSPADRTVLASKARNWLSHQAGASQRVIQLISKL